MKPLSIADYLDRLGSAAGEKAPPRPEGSPFRPRSLANPQNSGPGLKPVFDRKYGTLTAGNSSPLTDGAAAVLLMSEEKAKAVGLKPIGYLKSYAFAATDPFDQLLQGPVFALPIALERAGITLKDIGVIEMHGVRQPHVGPEPVQPVHVVHR